LRENSGSQRKYERQRATLHGLPASYPQTRISCAVIP
jgi:hypothetical protein